MLPLPAMQLIRPSESAGCIQLGPSYSVCPYFPNINDFSNSFMTLFFRLLCLFCSLLSFTSCSDDAEQAYAHIPAFFRFTPVSSAQPLNGALNNPGEFCKITIDARSFVFTDRAGHSIAKPRTALDAYGQPECIIGFVVGTPSTPNMNMQFQPLAFELACPACYENNMKSITMHFDKSNVNAMKCPRCQRVYDMSLQGAVIAGEPGPRMYWYRWLIYNNDTMIIRN